METRPRPTTLTVSKTRSIPRLGWPVPADNHDAENSDQRTVLLPRLAIAQHSQQLPQPGGAGWRAAPTAYRAPARRQKPFAEVRGPMTISDEDLIECWFSRLAAPEIVTKLGLQSTSELR